MSTSTLRMIIDSDLPNFPVQIGRSAWKRHCLRQARKWRDSALAARKRRDCPNWGEIMRRAEAQDWAEAHRCLRAECPAYWHPELS